MIQIDDIKVFGANAICMVLLKIQEMNDTLQSVLFFATIVYTVIRIINEVQKFKKNGKANSTVSPSTDED